MAYNKGCSVLDVKNDNNPTTTRETRMDKIIEVLGTFFVSFSNNSVVLWVTIIASVLFFAYKMRGENWWASRREKNSSPDSHRYFDGDRCPRCGDPTIRVCMATDDKDAQLFLKLSGDVDLRQPSQTMAVWDADMSLGDLRVAKCQNPSCNFAEDFYTHS